MVKKNRNRQAQESSTAQNGGDSAESCDQKKSSSEGRCRHTQKAVHLASIKRALKSGCLAADCPACIKDGLKTEADESEPNTGLWLCLQCGHQGCGRTQKEHALKHFRVVHSDPHCIVVNTTSWSVWCYTCEVELDSEYHKKLHECVKYLKNLDFPPSVQVSEKSDGNKEMENLEGSAMPLSDVTNMPHGVRTPKKKMISLTRVRGLQNLGNTCFFNSVMQCLAQTPYFLELLQDTRQGGSRFCLPGGKGLLVKSGEQKEKEEQEDEDLPPLEGTLTKWGTLTETLASTLEEMRVDDIVSVNPQRLFNKLTAKCPQFGGGDQHDAHELLRHLLDEVRTEDLKRYWMAILDQYGLSRHDTSDTVDTNVRSHVRAYGRQASDLMLLPDPVFRGILVSTVECQDCLHSNQRTETFYELSLSVTTKPQPPVMRRRTGGEDSFDVCGNPANETPSKHQLKKERRQQRKGRKKQQQQQKSTRFVDFSTGDKQPIVEEGRNSEESEQSDADVEDNVEQDRVQEDARIGELAMNGEVVPPLIFDMCNGNISGEGENKPWIICNGDINSIRSQMQCNGADSEKEHITNEKQKELVKRRGKKASENVCDREYLDGGEEISNTKQGTLEENVMNGTEENWGEELANEDRNSIDTEENEGVDSEEKCILDEKLKKLIKRTAEKKTSENVCDREYLDSGKEISNTKKGTLKGNVMNGTEENWGEELANEGRNSVDIEENELAQGKNTIMENKTERNKSTIEEISLIEKRDLMLNEVKENGIVEENKKDGDKIMRNRVSRENDICEEMSVSSDTVGNVDTSFNSNNLPFQVMNDNECKVCPIEELSLSISTAINSPSAKCSPVSITGSPSSVSCDLNVDLNLTNHLSSNNWHIEENDRPYSRIAFCNDDEPLNSNNNEIQTTPSTTENSLSGCVQMTYGGESACKETSSSDQLVKEMAGLSLGHDECQSPSHWDTCSAHSLEDLKDNKTVLPLEAPLCNGVSKCSEPESVDETDKSGTLAPRYHCGDKECSIESCLNQFTLLELMSGSCKVICENCSERINKGKEGKMVATNSTKQYLVSNPPAVLVLHLKRFEVHQNMFRKTPKHVTFPVLLDIAPICNTKCRELPTIRKGQTKVLYSLYGVVQHSGTLHGGHYSAYVKVRAPVKRDDMRWCFLSTTANSQHLDEISKGVSIPTEAIPGKWYHVSDSWVHEVNEDRVLQSQAYLLFYERVW